ncbi:carbon monoxide dehydrogenase [Thalassobaculum fulvum]|uniref:Carbon monoxide dehydrogenase n=1 Tax=Thalassobaculum fulvum TaxID=1633335 RepID=A0A919CQ48_9PROT|nr:xanthine dehydrogenase family protein molybdopterin-binding subunit [Thalassobaculum fulvum]GHD50728.1 carbon monoxide dehydrogenase [Thalassobaculum fulvum]
MAKFGIGQGMKRKEDQRFLTGHGRYTDDLAPAGVVRAVLVRSPVAHARITEVETLDAREAPGVLAVLTGEDVVADGLGDLPCAALLPGRDGKPAVGPAYPLLARDRVRHVGDAVALVVAETYEQARDAAELVEFSYDPLPAVPDIETASAPGAALVWDEAPGNLCLDWETGDAAAVEAAFATAARVAELTLVNNRIVVNSLEPRGVVAEYDGGAYTLHVSTQGPHGVRDVLCDILKIEPSAMRVVSPDVGGGFGMKIFPYREHALAAWAAKRTGRPVKWIGERTESFVSDTQGRDHRSTARMALDADGRFLGLSVDTRADLGAYLSLYGPAIPTVAGSGMLAGLYTTPAIHVRVRAYFTNTLPVDAYRGAGRPEAAYLVERLVDVCAKVTGIDRAEIRRRNFAPASAMPFTTALGETYDSGDFTAHLDKAMAESDWTGVEARKAASRKAGKLRGIGLSTYVEACGGGGPEWADMRVNPDGTVTVPIGTRSTGQGHETAYSQLVTEVFGIDNELVTVIQGDTAAIENGAGTDGSRSLPAGGSALKAAIDVVVRKGKRIAAHALEAAEADIELADGRFAVAGTDRSISLAEVATRALDPSQLPEGMEPGLSASESYKPKASTYPNGTHVCEVEVDPDTGVVQVDRYTVVDDFGEVVNPLLLQGQVHGGVAQGVGQALYERVVYDADAQLVTGSLMDYCLPRADNLPMVGFAMSPTRCTTNPLGVKGCGEAGAIGAPPAVINAVLDALAPLGVTDIDMPATPERVWSAIQAAKPAAAA